MSLYIPAPFRIDDPETLRAFIEANAFGTLVTAGPKGIHVSHIPFVIEPAPGGQRPPGCRCHRRDESRALDSL